MEFKPKNREWVKNAAIAFLAVLLVLTFFSNTIMNRTLPEVATQYVESGPITAKVRGSGTVVANGSHQVKADQTRDIRAVMVKVGQEVEAGDVLFVLGAGASEELEQAQEALRTLQLNYQKAALGIPSYDYSLDEKKIENAKNARDAAETKYKAASDALDKYLAQNKEDKDKIDAVKEKLIAAQKAYDDVSDAAYKSQNDAQKIVDEKQEALNKLLGGTTLVPPAEKMPMPSGVKCIKTEIVQQAAAITVSDEGNQDEGTETPPPAAPEPKVSYVYKLTGMSKDYSYKINDGLWLDVLKDGEIELSNFVPANDSVIRIVTKGVGGKRDSDAVIFKFNNEGNNPVEDKEVAPEPTPSESAEITAARAELEKAKLELEKIKTDNETALKLAQSNLDICQAEFDRLLSSGGSLKTAYDNAYTAYLDAEEKYQSAQRELQEKKKNTQISYIDLSDIGYQIEQQKKKIKELSGGEDNEITAKVSGTIQTVDCTAGDTKVKDDLLCTIEVPDMGYTMSFSVTNDQARRLRPGDSATVSNFYWGNSITATLNTIKVDPKNPQTNKLLSFDLEGDVSAGSELTLSVGQKSANYDVIIPNSSIRNDTNGSFVLKIEAKNSPLGNRYIARRVSVEVLAADDVNSAVTGDLGYGDYVITTSNAPVKTGDQVRMADS